MSHTIAYTTPMKVVEFLTLIICLAFNATLAIDDGSLYALVAFGGTFSGAFILAYFRREQTFGERLFKAGAGTVAGVVCGAFAEYYIGATDLRVVLFIFFLSGVLSLTFIRAALNVGERNGSEICLEFLQRVLGSSLQREPKKRRRDVRLPKGRYITHADDPAKEEENL